MSRLFHNNSTWYLLTLLLQALVYFFPPFFSYHHLCHLLCCDFCPQCPDICAVVGRRHREVQCVDSRSKRPLRPFHCQDVSSRPISTLTCPHKPCMAWSVSPWGPVGALYRLNFQIITLMSQFFLTFFFTSVLYYLDKNKCNLDFILCSY